MAIKFVLVEIVLVETVLVGDPLYILTKSFKVASFLTMLEMVTAMISTITYNVHLIEETVVDLVLTDWNAQIANVFRILDSLMILSKMH